MVGRMAAQWSLWIRSFNSGWLGDVWFFLLDWVGVEVVLGVTHSHLLLMAFHFHAHTNTLIQTDRQPRARARGQA
jgi:hypothetical protein